MSEAIINKDSFRPYPLNQAYEVDTEGNVRSSATLSRMGAMKGAPMKNHWKGTRYVVMLSDNGKRSETPVAKMVAMTFHGPPPTPEADVRFLDGDRRNVSASNLEWDSGSDEIPLQLLESGEQARRINGVSGYWVTSYGRVYSIKRQIFLTPIDIQLHYEVALYQAGKIKRRSLPKLVAEHFPEISGESTRPNSPMQQHIDGDKKNCRADNLRWTTQQALLKDRGQVRRAVQRHSTSHQESERTEASLIIRFLLREYKNTLPDAEPRKHHRYYYIDARFHPLCGACATKRAQAQLNDLSQVDESFPVNQHVLFSPKSVLSWEIREIICTDCGTTVSSFHGERTT